MGYNKSLLTENCKCLLGEGLFITDNYMYWLDIINKKLFKLSNDGLSFSSVKTNRIPSVILDVKDDNSVMLANENGIETINFVSQSTVTNTNRDFSDDIDIRSNDGVKLDEMLYLYGTMGKKASDHKKGKVYFYDELSHTDSGIELNIPNLFVRLDNERILIADSLESKVYLFRLNFAHRRLEFIKVWYDFGHFGAAPDGGCLGRDGLVYIALWNGASIAVLSREGNFLERIMVPALKPTNCQFNKYGDLIVTTAIDNMTDNELEEYPWSGELFKLSRCEDE